MNVVTMKAKNRAMLNKSMMSSGHIVLRDLLSKAYSDMALPNAQPCSVSSNIARWSPHKTPNKRVHFLSLKVWSLAD